MTLKSLYYFVKPALPRSVQIGFRRKLFMLKLPKVQCSWPISESSATPPLGWSGWPDGKKFAFVLTHDVETSVGMAKCKELAKIDLKYGFRSLFNIVPCKYDVPESTRLWLQDNGFEIGVHDYNHDGKLYKSEKIFEERSKEINRYLKEWKSVTFRSAAMHHNLEWLSKLNIECDCSTFDTDPFEPQPDGVNTVFPYYYQNEMTGRGFIEIPYTLPQDITLFVIKKDTDCSIWKEKIKWIAEKGGMATVIVHPDYINMSKDQKNGVSEYSGDLYEEFLEYVSTRYKDQCWNPLPKTLSEFCKNCYSKAIESQIAKTS